MNYARNVFYIGNLEIGRLRAGEITFYNLDGDEIEKECKEIEWDAEAAEKGGYEHFMMKEIHEQPKVIMDTINSVLKDGKIDLSKVELSDEEIKDVMSNNNYKYRFFITIVIQISLLLLPDYSWIISHKFMFVCYWIGYIVADYNLLIENFFFNKILLCSIAIWLLLMMFYTRDSYIYTTGYSLFGEKALGWYKQLGIDMYRIIIGLFGSVSIIGSMYLISKTTKLQINYLAWCGKNSLGIYVISSFLYSYVIESFFKVHLNSLFSMYALSIVETIIILVVCTGLINIIKKSKILSCILIG